MDALITGGAGFIGSHLSEELLGAGHRVFALDDLSTGRLANVEHLLDDPRFEFAQGSVLDAELVDQLVSRCDRVFHLAASVGVRLILDNPLECYKNNVDGTERVLEAAQRYDARVLLASTSEVYGKNTSDALAEDDDRVMGSPLRTRWSYASAKAVDELYAYCYWRHKGLRAVIVRLFNTVGPRQTGRYGMVIPRFAEQALRGQPITVYGDGAQTRCFAYVGDIVPALAKLIDLESAYGKAFNLGSREETSIAELARVVARVAGSSAGVDHIPYSEAYGDGFEDMRRRVPDTTLAREAIGFEPAVGLVEIVERVVAERRAELETETLELAGSGAASRGVLRPHATERSSERQRQGALPRSR